VTEQFCWLHLCFTNDKLLFIRIEDTNRHACQIHGAIRLGYAGGNHYFILLPKHVPTDAGVEVALNLLTVQPVRKLTTYQAHSRTMFNFLIKIN